MNAVVAGKSLFVPHAEGLRELKRGYTGRLDLGEGRVLETAMRHLPARRLSGPGTLNGRPVFLKLFFDKRKASRDFERERQMAMLLSERHVPTPALIDAGTLAGGGGWMAMQLLESPITLKDAWRDMGLRDELLAKMHTLLGAVYQARLIQADAHLGNFAFANGQLYLLDPGGVKAVRLGYARRIQENLALFIAQFAWQDHALLVAALGDLVDGQDGGGDQQPLGRIIRRAWQDRIDRLARKMLRASAWVTRWQHHDLRGYARRSRFTDQLRDMLSSAAAVDRLMANGVSLKEGNSATVARVACDGRELVFKRYNLKNASMALKRALGSSRARRSWVASHWLEYAGIATALPVAMLEERRFGFLRRAWFITETLSGEDAWVRYRARPPSEAEMRSVIDLFAALAYTGVCHGDLKATNIIMCDSTAHLIDLDACHLTDLTRSASKCLEEDRQRYMLNWSVHPESAKQFREGLERVRQQMRAYRR